MWTSGLTAAGNVVTSLIRRPATTGPAGPVRLAGVRRRGAARWGGGLVVVVVAAAGGVEALLVVDGVDVVVDRGVVVVDGGVVVGCEEVVVGAVPREPPGRCEPV